MIKKLSNFWAKSEEELNQLNDAANDEGNEDSSAIDQTLPAETRKAKKNLFNLLQKYHYGEIKKEALTGHLRVGFNLLNCCSPDEQDKILRTILEVELGMKTDKPLIDDEYDIFYDMVSHIYHKRQEKVHNLLKKAAPKIYNQDLEISKETIDFITSITDSQLELIKEMFRYVINNSIFRYENIENDFRAQNFNQTGSDNIKFLGKIFYNQDSIGGKTLILKPLEALDINGVLIWKVLIPEIIIGEQPFTEETLTQYLSDDNNRDNFQAFLDKYPYKIIVLNLDGIKFYITKQPTEEGFVTLEVSCFTILTDVGVELYALLKDEIGKYPEHYLPSVVGDEQYNSFGLKFALTA